jgi:hypothetical protein
MAKPLHPIKLAISQCAGGWNLQTKLSTVCGKYRTPAMMRGDGLMVMDGHELRYSAVGRFRIVFELRPSSSQPPGSLIVTNIVAFSK